MEVRKCQECPAYDITDTYPDIFDSVHAELKRNGFNGDFTASPVRLQSPAQTQLKPS